MPLGLRFQKPLELGRGMIPTDSVDVFLLVCRRQPRAGAGAGARDADLA
jgi:hypothetical protein